MELRGLFGEDIADTVVELTDTNSSARPRASACRSRGPDAPVNASAVKLATRSATCANILASPPAAGRGSRRQNIRLG